MTFFKFENGMRRNRKSKTIRGFVEIRQVFTNLIPEKYTSATLVKKMPVRTPAGQWGYEQIYKNKIKFNKVRRAGQRASGSAGQRANLKKKYIYSG
jgi:hypothetical protein